MSHARSEVSTFTHVNRLFNDNNEVFYFLESETEEIIKGLILRDFGHFGIKTENLQPFTLSELKKMRAKLHRFDTLQRKGKIPTHLQKLPSKSNSQAFIACILDSEALLQDFIDYSSSIGSSEERAYWFELSLYLGNEVIPKWLLMLNKNELYTQNWLDKCARSGNLEMLKFYTTISTYEVAKSGVVFGFSSLVASFMWYKLSKIENQIRDYLPACQTWEMRKVLRSGIRGYTLDDKDYEYVKSCADLVCKGLENRGSLFAGFFMVGTTIAALSSVFFAGDHGFQLVKKIKLSTTSMLQETIRSGNEELLMFLLDPIHNFNLLLCPAILGFNVTEQKKYISSVISCLLKDPKKYKTYIEEIFSMFHVIHQHSPECSEKLLQYILSDVNIFKGCVKNELKFNEIAICFPSKTIFKEILYYRNHINGTSEAVFKDKGYNEVISYLEVCRASRFLVLGDRDSSSTFFQKFPKDVLVEIASKVSEEKDLREEEAAHIARNIIEHKMFSQ